MTSNRGRDRAMTELRSLIADTRPQQFFTLTTRYSVPPDQFERLIRGWLNRCNRTLFGRRWYLPKGKELTVTGAIEIGAWGRAHAHVLIAHPDRPLRVEEVAWLKVAWTRYGRVDQKPIAEPQGVSQYIIKSVPAGGCLFFSKRYWSQR